VGFHSGFYSIKDIKADCAQSIVDKVERTIDLNLNNLKAKGKDNIGPPIHLTAAELNKNLAAPQTATTSKTSKTSLKPTRNP
jgi:hypothetical protein